MEGQVFISNDCSILDEGKYSLGQSFVVAKEELASRNSVGTFYTDTPQPILDAGNSPFMDIESKLSIEKGRMWILLVRFLPQK